MRAHSLTLVAIMAGCNVFTGADPPAAGAAASSPCEADFECPRRQACVDAVCVRVDPGEVIDGGSFFVDGGCEGCEDQACGNGVRDGQETDVDCGGSQCSSCTDGAACSSGTDCSSLVCANLVCQVPSCEDGARNQFETDIDCGGFACGPCEDGATCVFDDDCLSQACGFDSGRCATSCDDRVQNGDESDIDCGGGGCEPCAQGGSCDGPADCVSSVCNGGTCAGASCFDGVKNGPETDVDCGGGSSCEPCGTGGGCLSSSDCHTTAFGFGVPCSAERGCLSLTCANFATDDDETDVDCGGSCAPELPCAEGSSCLDDTDCRSSHCNGGLCELPRSCTDGMVSGDESDVDCGGACVRCEAQLQCGDDSDCVSGICTDRGCEVTCAAGFRPDGAGGCAENDSITVRGVVTGYDGAPLAGALVGAEAIDAGRAYPGVVADASGAYLMNLAPAPSAGDLIVVVALDPADPAVRLPFLTMARAAGNAIGDAFPASLDAEVEAPGIDLSPLTTLASAAFPLWDEDLAPADAFSTMGADFVDVDLGSEIELVSALGTTGWRAAHRFSPPARLTVFANPPGELLECLEQAAMRAAAVFRAGNAGGAEAHQDSDRPETTWDVVVEGTQGTALGVAVGIAGVATRGLRVAQTGNLSELKGGLESGTACDEEMRIANVANRRTGVANCREFTEFTALYVFDNCRSKGARQISMVRGNAVGFFNGSWFKGHAFTLVSDLPEDDLDLSKLISGRDQANPNQFNLAVPDADSPGGVRFLSEEERKHIFVVDGWGLNATTDPTSRANIQHYVRDYPVDYLNEFGLDQLGANRRVAIPGTPGHIGFCNGEEPPPVTTAEATHALAERAAEIQAPAPAGEGETCGSCGRPDVAVCSGGLETCSRPEPTFADPADDAVCGDCFQGSPWNDCGVCGDETYCLFEEEQQCVGDDHLAPIFPTGGNPCAQGMEQRRCDPAVPGGAVGLYCVPADQVGAWRCCGGALVHETQACCGDTVDPDDDGPLVCAPTTLRGGASICATCDDGTKDCVPDQNIGCTSIHASPHAAFRNFVGNRTPGFGVDDSSNSCPICTPERCPFGQSSGCSFDLGREYLESIQDAWTAKAGFKCSDGYALHLSNARVAGAADLADISACRAVVGDLDITGEVGERLDLPTPNVVLGSVHVINTALRAIDQLQPMIGRELGRARAESDFLVDGPPPAYQFTGDLVIEGNSALESLALTFRISPDFAQYRTLPRDVVVRDNAVLQDISMRYSGNEFQLAGVAITRNLVIEGNPVLVDAGAFTTLGAFRFAENDSATFVRVPEGGESAEIVGNDVLTDLFGVEYFLGDGAGGCVAKPIVIADNPGITDCYIESMRRAVQNECGGTGALGGLAVSGITELCPGASCASSDAGCGGFPCEQRSLYNLSTSYTWCE